MIGLLAFLILSVFSIFLRVSNLHLMDSIFLGGAAALGSRSILHFHPALCLVVFIVVLGGTIMLQAFSVSYWILSLLFSVGYGIGIGWCVFDEWNDMVWAVVIGALVFFGSLLLHWMHSPNNKEEFR